eukprot:jgi/Galph1/4739/GphlegSOOS_G3319.1
MPSNADNFFFRFVLEYLQRKGYKNAAETLKQSLPIDSVEESFHNPSTEMEDQVRNFIEFFINSEQEEINVLDDYEKVYRWVDGCLEVVRVELAQFLYPLLVYLFLELVGKERYEESQKLLNKWYNKFGEQTIQEELFSLSGIHRKELLLENSLAQQYLKHRREIFVSTYAFELLCDFLVENKLTRIFRCLMEHFHIRIDTKAKATVSSEVESAVGFFSFAELERLRTKQVDWKNLQSSEYIIDDSEHADEPQSSTETKQIDASEIQSRIPLPKYSLGSFVLDSEEDIERRSVLAPERLPSCLMYTFLNTYDELNCLDISKDGSTVVGGFSDSFIRLWDAKECGQYRLIGGKPLIGHSGSIYSLSFSPCGRFFLSSSKDGSIRLWSTKMERDLVVYKGHIFPVWSVQFSPFSHYFVSGGHDRVGRLWSTDRIFPLRLLGGHFSDIEVVQWHPNCCYVATGSSDRSSRLWDLGEGESVRVFGPHSSAVCSMVFLQNGRVLVIGLENGDMEFWDIGEGRRISRVKGHDGPVWCMDVSKEGALFVSASSDCTVRTWNGHLLENYSQQQQLTKEQLFVTCFKTKKSPVYCTRFTRKNLLVVGGAALY